MRRTVFSFILLVGTAFLFTSCDLFGEDEDHVDAFGYELEQNGEILVSFDGGAGEFELNENTDFYHDGEFTIGSQVLSEDGYTDPVTIHFLDENMQRLEVGQFEEDGGEDEWLLGWNDTDADRLDLGGVELVKEENQTWQFRFFTEERGNTNPQHAGTPVAFEIWHIDHPDFTASELDLYVLTEYEEAEE